MKNLSIYPLLLCCLFFSATCLAQHYDFRIFKQGQTDGWIGLGLVPTYIMDGAEIVVPPINIGADHFVSDNVSLGLIMGHSISNSKPVNGGGEFKSYRNSYWFSGFRLAVHCTKIDNFDIYGGFTVGYNLTLIEPMDGNWGAFEEKLGIVPRSGKATYSSMLGLRYSCCGPISFFGELGWSSSLVTVGVGYRLQ